MKKHFLIIFILLISLYATFEKNYSYEFNKKNCNSNTITILEESVQIKTNEFDMGGFINILKALLEKIAEILNIITPVTDGNLTSEVKKILRENGYDWVNANGKTTCASAGLSEFPVTTKSKIACLAYSQVGRSWSDCCKFVKKMYELAGANEPICYKNNNHAIGSPGEIAQWGSSNVHVAIYISQAHVISGGWDAKKNGKRVVVDKTFTDTNSKYLKTENGEFQGFH